VVVTKGGRAKIVTWNGAHGTDHEKKTLSQRGTSLIELHDRQLVLHDWQYWDGGLDSHCDWHKLQNRQQSNSTVMRR